MRILVKNEIWRPTADFSESLSPFIKAQTKIAVVGSGGKTSIIMQLAEEQKALGKKVLVLTTTHMYVPSKYGVVSGIYSDVEKALQTDDIAVVGDKTNDGKITWLGDELYKEILPLADIILIEADGSKRLPLKYPNENEPVIPPEIDIILVVYGLNAIGKNGNEACHRWAFARKAFNIANEDETLKPEHLSLLMKEGYLKPLKTKHPSALVIPLLNQADDKMLEELGKIIIDELKTEIGIVSSMLSL
ncbi:MAG: putative selenium-dependent hydroxylase accessory protein YqeC [Oscillospiraceae bacterium]|nr:putative selenium-dependent hydroxylase accessory protein YqeC [Oscillospiraceae bacterium]